MNTHQDVINFWFNELSPKQWWAKDAALDALIESRFGALHRQAIAGELFAWRACAVGCLAEVIVLDQFSRNIYRDQAAAFASDAAALMLAQCAIAQGFDQQLPSEQRAFLYMPFMHSESPLIHTEAVMLFKSLDASSGGANNLDFELKHKAIIDRFGRYPHRNSILGRQSTPEELAFLTEPNSSF